MKPYSEDLRTRIVRALEEAMSKSGAARLFGVSLSSLKCYARIAARGSSLEPRKGGGRLPKTAQSTKKLLERDVKERPTLTTVAQRRRFLEHAKGKTLSDSTVLWLLKKMGFTQNTDCGSAGTGVVVESSLEGDGRRAHRSRANSSSWTNRSMGSNTSLHSLYACSERGERAYYSTPRNRGRNTTLLSSMSIDGMEPSLAVIGAVDTEVFEAYLEESSCRSCLRDM